MKNKKKTEVEIIEEYLKKEGFTEITEKEKKSVEYRDSLLATSKVKKSNICKVKVKKY